MEVMYCMLAGLAGTALMTAFMALVSKITGYNFKVPVILGTMATMKTNPSGRVSGKPKSKLPGILLHYAIGILFAAVYYGLMKAGYVSRTYKHALIFGMAAGIAAVTFWLLFLKFHPLAPVVNRSFYLPLIFLGHLLFALGMIVVFNAAAI